VVYLRLFHSLSESKLLRLRGDAGFHTSLRLGLKRAIALYQTAHKSGLHSPQTIRGSQGLQAIGRRDPKTSATVSPIARNREWSTGSGNCVSDPLRLLDRRLHDVASLGRRAVVVADVPEAKEVRQREPGVRGAFADPAVDDRLVARFDPMFLLVDRPQLIGRPEGVRLLVDGPPPRNAPRPRDVAAAQRAPSLGYSGICSRSPRYSSGLRTSTSGLPILFAALFPPVERRPSGDPRKTATGRSPHYPGPRPVARLVKPITLSDTHARSGPHPGPATEAGFGPPGAHLLSAICHPF